MIAGLEEITAGTIRLGGRMINDVEPKNRDIAMVFQNYALYPHMTVAENMGFSLRLAGRPKAEIDERVIEAPRILGLERYLAPLSARSSPADSASAWRWAAPSSAIPRSSSSTSRSRTSTPSSACRCAPRSSELHQRLGTTTIYVTHDQIEAMTMADCIVVMHDGRIEQVGTPARPLRPTRPTSSSPASSARRR